MTNASAMRTHKTEETPKRDDACTPAIARIHITCSNLHMLATHLFELVDAIVPLFSWCRAHRSHRARRGGPRRRHVHTPTAQRVGHLRRRCAAARRGRASDQWVRRRLPLQPARSPQPGGVRDERGVARRLPWRHHGAVERALQAPTTRCARRRRCVRPGCRSWA